MEWSTFGFLGDLAEMFSTFSQYFYTWFTNLFTMTMYDALTVVLGGAIPEWDFLTETTMGVFMFGFGLVFYVGYQLMVWVLKVFH